MTMTIKTKPTTWKWQYQNGNNDADKRKWKIRQESERVIGVAMRDGKRGWRGREKEIGKHRSQEMSRTQSLSNFVSLFQAVALKREFSVCPFIGIYFHLYVRLSLQGNWRGFRSSVTLKQLRKRLSDHDVRMGGLERLDTAQEDGPQILKILPTQTHRKILSCTAQGCSSFSLWNTFTTPK